MITKTIEIDENFFIEITFSMNDSYLRLYSLNVQYQDKMEEIIRDSCRDRFLTECNKIIKLPNWIECLVASY